MCSPHVSFLSNVIPKNVIWSLNSISLPNKVSFCNDPMFIFLPENIMALVFKVEILKPKSWDHISISSRVDWILLSASLGDECLVQIALSFANWESDRFGTSPRASSKVFIMTLYLTPNDIRIGRCSLPHDWFIGFQVVWGLISVVARVRSGAVAKSAIVGVPSFRMVRL